MTATATTWSPGWGSRVMLGTGQAHTLGVLRASIHHPSRTWHDAPRLRAFGRSSSTAHRALRRLASLGVVALQASLGCQGGVRFTLGVRRWRWEPPRRAHLVRMVHGQLELLPDDGGQDRPRPAETDKPPETAPLERPRTPETGGGGVHVHSGFTERMTLAGFRAWWRE